MVRPVTVEKRMALPPNICYKCRGNETSPGRTYFVDTGLDIDYEGVVYICDLCFKDMVRHTDDTVVKSDMLEIYSEASQKLYRAEQLQIKYDRVVAYLTSLGFNVELLETAPPLNTEPPVKTEGSEKEIDPPSEETRAHNEAVKNDNFGLSNVNVSYTDANGNVHFGDPGVTSNSSSVGESVESGHVEESGGVEIERGSDSGIGESLPESDGESSSESDAGNSEGEGSADSKSDGNEQTADSAFTGSSDKDSDSNSKLSSINLGI